jgi:hypothetical protein
MKWKLALAQHPMYLLIREDSQCAERTPPWGAPDISSYSERVRRNLQALQRYPQLKLGYEWSGLELELLHQDAPDVLIEMRKYADQGRIQFYNGTYAQPHLQTLSSEANLRQFQYGLETYRELGLQPPLAYVHQEASVHEQLPQILSAFGFKYAALPGFISTMVWMEEGELIHHTSNGLRFFKGCEFAAWQGLDETCVPLYLHQPIPREFSLPETLAREAVMGRLGAPPVMIDMPDMIEITPEWLADRRAVEFVLLNEALEERLRAAPERSRVRLYTNWSYLEGIRAEELSRANWLAERSALRAEAIQAIAFVVLRKTPASTGQIWKTILACQHHDVYCFSAPELRQKSIQRIYECDSQARQMIKEVGAAIAASVHTRDVGGQPVILINTLPHPIKAIVRFEISSGCAGMIDASGRFLPIECIPLEEGTCELSIPVSMPGLGYSTVALQAGGEPAPWEQTHQPLEFQNRFFQAVVSPDGVLLSLRTQPDGFELLDRRRGGGNRLSATDSEAISLKQEGLQERFERLTSDPPVRGPELVWEPVSPTRILRSPVGVSLLAAGTLGPRIRAQVLLHFYHDLPRIDLTWNFEFLQASVGTFFDDDSKLLLHWPLSFRGNISHDIPFGVVETRPDRPFFPTSWVDISDGRRGVAFFHQGTPAHWVSQNTLFDLLAWGEDTDAIHNGLGRNRWLKSFDQRLNGSHTINSALYIHSGDWQAGGVATAVLAYNHPPLPVLTDSHAGSLPLEADILHLGEPGLIASAVFCRDDQVICRAYNAGNQSVQGESHLDGLRNITLQTIAGKSTSSLSPYQIGEIIFTLKGRKAKTALRGEEKDK